MSKAIHLFLACMLVPLCLSSLAIFYSVITKELENKEAEGKCIKSFIQTGIERKDIIAKDGICYLKEK
ncbi:MAG: hypothetical protein ACRCVV_21950 [Shewanella sp.]